MGKMTAPPILTSKGGVWTPAPEARGPFAGQHGGCVITAMVAPMETMAAESGAGQPLSLYASFLRPVPLAPVEVETSVVREGERVLVISAELFADGKLSAQARVIFSHALAIPGLEEPALEPAEPTVHPEVFFHPVNGKGPWLGDATEFRKAPDGTYWMRLTRPLVATEAPLAYAATLADYSTGLSRPDGWEKPVIGAFPNADISVHLARPPELADGGWVGLGSESHWSPRGLGFTETTLHDRRGRFGRCVQAVVLMPVEKAD
jgi:hypothetical protein